jgi:hypothetical protein
MNDTLPTQTKRLVGCFPFWGIHIHNYHVADILPSRSTMLFMSLPT